MASIQISLLIYILFFYSAMTGGETDIATQFASNELSSNMVVVLIIMIIIVCFDRVLYSTHAFLSGATKTSYNDEMRVVEPLSTLKP